MYDLHTLQNRFYLHGNAIASLQTTVPLLIDRIKNTEINCIAFPDDGAAKRFSYMFQELGNLYHILSRIHFPYTFPVYISRIHFPYIYPVYISRIHIPYTYPVYISRIHIPYVNFILQYSWYPGIYLLGYEIITCGKMRDGDSRLVVIQDGMTKLYLLSRTPYDHHDPS